MAKHKELAGLRVKTPGMPGHVKPQTRGEFFFCVLTRSIIFETSNDVFLWLEIEVVRFFSFAAV